jgi:hypothetical protein
MVAAEDITGTWLVVDRGNDDPADEQVSVDRYGDNPQGMVIISPDGWMCAALCHGDRPALTGDPAWHTDAPDQDRLSAFDTYISYGGRWTLEDGVFATDVEFALNPGWVGDKQIREAEILPTGELRLLLSRNWPDGRAVNAWVLWRRAGG